MSGDPWSSSHVKWLVNTGEQIKTKDGIVAEVWEFKYKNDCKILSAWAKHFRNHYCFDTEIDYFRKGYKYSRKEYLEKIKFPDQNVRPGPSIRAGDFGEILVADFLEYILGYWVPRTRYEDKTIRNESEKGCDIIGFHWINEAPSSEDILALFEAKTQFSGKKSKARLQDAVNGSAKDFIRKAESLNAIKQRLYGHNEFTDAHKIERFQNEVDHPYRQVYGAVALFENRIFSSKLTSLTNTSKHPSPSNLSLVVIKGKELMGLVNAIYKRAADEA